MPTETRIELEMDLHGRRCSEPTSTYVVARGGSPHLKATTHHLLAADTGVPEAGTNLSVAS